MGQHQPHENEKIANDTQLQIIFILESRNWVILVLGGISPFFAVNRFRTMAKVLEVNYSLDREELHKASDEAKDFITQYLNPP